MIIELSGKIFSLTKLCHIAQVTKDPKANSSMKPSTIIVTLTSFVLFSLMQVSEAGTQTLRFELAEVVTNSQPIGRLPSETNLNLVIGLPLRNQGALSRLLRE